MFKGKLAPEQFRELVLCGGRPRLIMYPKIWTTP
jgi:hypothetical protein